jgi:hypothetical protein
VPQRLGCDTFEIDAFRREPGRPGGCLDFDPEVPLSNFKPEYQFVVRQYAIGKGHSVSVLRRGGEVDTIFGFDKEADALAWIKEKSQAWLLENK